MMAATRFQAMPSSNMGRAHVFFFVFFLVLPESYIVLFKCGSIDRILQWFYINTAQRLMNDFCGVFITSEAGTT